MPEGRALPGGLAAVLAVVHLIFNEGHAGLVDLAGEAISLGGFLAELMPDESEVPGLLSLMLPADARREARHAGDEVVLLANQAQSLWDSGRTRTPHPPPEDPPAARPPALKQGDGRSRRRGGGPPPGRAGQRSQRRSPRCSRRRRPCACPPRAVAARCERRSPGRMGSPGNKGRSPEKKGRSPAGVVCDEPGRGRGGTCARDRCLF